VQIFNKKYDLGGYYYSNGVWRLDRDLVLPAGVTGRWGAGLETVDGTTWVSERDGVKISVELQLQGDAGGGQAALRLQATCTAKKKDRKPARLSLLQQMVDVVLAGHLLWWFRPLTDCEPWGVLRDIRPAVQVAGNKGDESSMHACTMNTARTTMNTCSMADTETALRDWRPRKVSLSRGCALAWLPRRQAL
jgi:hypothetical protein